ncbi:hypothetical protein RZN05_00800 [Sphingomonas sp. HF-S4]|uniref:Uncharacterized protein n=1 Tax=Sphingomonas agrestis TaxID=3080540 RepID=A0ABU3Y2A1_9SPHN|nr:hypothetical protein [Sphingomonas sp. HF-S4]MDV3455505.1 hypothetical protein [Sphingomonas sp. HF-S4]
MQLWPMDEPAEIRRSHDSRTVAKGPLVIMAHGLLAIADDARDGYRICSAIGELDAEQAEEALRRWTVPRYHAA